MTSERVFVWTWLPGSDEPVVAGAVELRGDTMPFVYAASYRNRAEAISLYQPELPLQSGTIQPLPGLAIAGAIRDGSPDAWGRAVIDDRREPDEADLTELDYMLASGSNRFGAIDFQQSPTEYVPRESPATLAELQEASATLQAGGKLPAPLEDVLIRGTSIGGARPKATLLDDGVAYIAKFSSSSDSVFSVVNAEGVAMELARRAGIRTSMTEVLTVDSKDVLLVRRFDRDGRERKHVVSALTMSQRNEWSGTRASYPELLDTLRRHGSLTFEPGRELFERIAFNMAISNSDDHARNHAAFWDGTHLTLTPAYDLAPNTRSGDTATQAMAYGRSGEKRSNFAELVKVSVIYGLSTAEARRIIDNIIETIRDHFDEAADLARVPARDVDLLKNHLFLNPGVLYDYEP